MHALPALGAGDQGFGLAFPGQRLSEGSRRRATAAVLAVVLLLLASVERAARAQDAPPATDEAPAGADLGARFDPILNGLLARFSLPGAGFAVVHGGRLVFVRGYGWADVAAQRPVEPTTPFLLASVSKSITAATVMKLVEDGRLQLDARAFQILDDIQPMDPERVDPRTAQITVLDLLYHAGGWDRQTSGDPLTYGERVARALDVRQPIGPRELVRYMLSQPLDFAPGTKCVYSNYGYMLLGLVIERVTGQAYGPYVRESTLAPMGIHGIVQGAGRNEYAPGEARRYGPDQRLDPHGGLPVLDFASGSWIASPVEMAKFMAVIGGERPPAFLQPQTFRRMLEPPPPPIPLRPNGTHFGMGWDAVGRNARGVMYEKDGGVLGTTTWVEHRPNGAAWVLLLNSSNRADGQQLHEAFLREIRQALDDVAAWPQQDLFDAYP